MAKRKRLSPMMTPPEPPAGSHAPIEAGGEVKGRAGDWGGTAPVRQAPIADIAGAAATAAALEDVSEELRAARADGRMILSLDLDCIDESYMVRDRVEIDPADMQALVDSIAARGQQVPVEVVDLNDGRYGLISGWRRLVALRALKKRTGEARFSKIQALNRTPDTASDVYLAMVEENEIRSGVSFYERARIAVRASEQGVYDSPKSAVRALFAAAPRAKRSKINSFVLLYEAMGDALRFPSALSERQGLALAKALQENKEVGAVMKSALTARTHKTPEAELAALKSALLESSFDTKAKNSSRLDADIPAGYVQKKPVYLRLSKGKLVLNGEGITPALETELRAWLASHS